MKIKVIFIVFTICTIVFSCTKDQAAADDCDPITANFLTDIAPIIETKCSADQGCHNAGSLFGDFTSYNNMLEDLNNGKIELRALDQKTMPPDGIEPLTENEVELLSNWICNGYPEN